MLCLRRLSVILTVTCLLATTAHVLYGQTPKETPQEEAARLVAVLKSDASVFDKAKACQRLAVIGNKEAVPALAALLADENLSNYARCGLEAIPDPAADDALREALGRLDGNRLIGVISSIGRRRDAKAIDGLTKRLDDDDPAVAAVAFKALGYIGNAPAAGILQNALPEAAPNLRPAVASACLLCAEGLLKRGQRDEALALYDTLRKADVPKHAVMAATLQAIVARGNDGIPLLVEQLESDDEARFRNAIYAARSLGGGVSDVSDVLMTQFDKQPAARQVLLLLALGDIGDKTALPTILKAAKTGTGELRVQAIRLLATFGDASVVPMLFDAAAESDESIAQAAKSTLAALKNKEVDLAIVEMLDTADAGTRLLAIELAGQRCIGPAAPALLKLADDPEASVRLSAIGALGTTIGIEHFPRLLARIPAKKTPDEESAVKRAIQVACARTPDREVCAEQLSQVMSGAQTEVKIFLLEQLATVGGTKSLATIVAAARSEEDAIQDAATRVLGEWMSADAAPELFDLAKTLTHKKYRIRALRGYIRIARQLSASPEQSVEICRNALAIADRDDERTLTIDVLGRVATSEALTVVVTCLNDDRLKGRAAGAVIAIGEKLVQTSPGQVAKAVGQALPAASNPALTDRASVLLAQAERLSSASGDEEGFVSIFDGKTMKGWEGNLDMFRIEDGAIVAGTMKGRIPKNEFLCTEKEYENFELRLQFKLVGERPNAGVQIRSRRIPNHNEVSGYQADLGPGWWGCLYDESRRRRVLAGPETPEKRAEPVRANDWNDYRIRCEGKRVQLWINDVQTIDYTEEDQNIEQKGIIGVQVHSGAPMEAWYRKIRIKEL